MEIYVFAYGHRFIFSDTYSAHLGHLRQETRRERALESNRLRQIYQKIGCDGDHVCYICMCIHNYIRHF